MTHRFRPVRLWWSAWLAALTLWPAAGVAQDASAQARTVYAEVNARSNRMEVQRFRARLPRVEYGSEVTAWLENGRVRKLAVNDPDDSGHVLTEHYFAADGALVFTYRAIQGFDAQGRARTRNEGRLYFQDAKPVRMLSGLDKVALGPSDPLVQEEAALALESARVFTRVALSPAAPTVRVGGQHRVHTATVDELVPGDIACHLELTDDSGRMHSEMAGFELCERPGAWRGQRVQLTYTLARVMAAACQGDTRCRQTDTVPLVTRLKISR